MTATTDHFLGIDVHKRQAQVAVLDDEGEVVEEVRVSNANLDAGCDGLDSTTIEIGRIRHWKNAHRGRAQLDSADTSI